MRTSDLKGAALDWTVAKCEGRSPGHYKGVCRATAHPDFPDSPPMFGPEMNYSTDWAQGGPIIEREGMQIYMVDHSFWGATMWWDDEHGASEFTQKGPTPLIAAMRCYVASKLGDEVDVHQFEEIGK